jgi:hypothetical protein
MLCHAGIVISEPMLFGLGQGIDFQCWNAPDPGPSMPMLTGRVGPGELSRSACAALGVDLCESQPPDPDAACREAVELLASGHVVGMTVDIYHLDYFASRSHFAAHYIALYGLDDSLAYIVDTDQQGGARTLCRESLRRARNSSEGFMPSPNLQMHVAGLPAQPHTDIESVLHHRAWDAIRETAMRVLSDRGSKSGVNGLRTAAAEISTWGDKLGPTEGLIPSVGRFWRLAGTGGANFRALYLDFLWEARQRTDDASLDPAVDDFDDVRQHWERAIDLLLAYRNETNPKGQLKALEAQMHLIADAEQSAFERLLNLASNRVGDSP